MDGLIEYMNQYEWFRTYLDYVLNMPKSELLLVIAITAVLLLFIFYKWFGVGGVTAMVVFLFLLLILWQADMYGTYLERQHDTQRREDLYQRELSKDLLERAIDGNVGNPAENN